MGTDGLPFRIIEAPPGALPDDSILILGPRPEPDDPHPLDTLARTSMLIRNVGAAPSHSAVGGAEGQTQKIIEEEERHG